jgi:hypothetical protein
LSIGAYEFRVVVRQQRPTWPQRKKQSAAAKKRLIVISEFLGGKGQDKANNSSLAARPLDKWFLDFGVVAQRMGWA